MSGTGGGHPGALPRRSAWFVRGFRKYARRFLARNFHALRVDRDGRPTEPPPGPAIVVMNHASWWDPMTGLVLSGSFSPERAHYAPMDADGLRQYRILERIGLFGVELDSPKGGLEFLRKGAAILARPESMLWITPQGRFADVRDRPIRFKEGLGRLLDRAPRASASTLAIEYVFWNDRKPEALVRFGPWLEVGGRSQPPGSSWTTHLEAALAEQQDRLADAARSRNPDRFESLIQGAAGVGGAYDLARRIRSTLRGEAFTREHRTQRPADDGRP